jgi:hypothetical protein
MLLAGAAAACPVWPIGAMLGGTAVLFESAWTHHGFHHLAIFRGIAVLDAPARCMALGDVMHTRVLYLVIAVLVVGMTQFSLLSCGAKRARCVG